MPDPISQSDLEAYLDEALPSDEMVRVEQILRADPALLQQLSTINSRRDAGVHSVAEIWRRNRVSCPTREQLGSFLLGAVDKEFSSFIECHLHTVGCRMCLANVEDLRREQSEQPAAASSRRRKYFQSSAGHLRRK